MTKQEFHDLASKKILFLDGATGSNLQKRGMPTGVCPELWISEHPEVLQGLQREYAEAGSDIVYAPTFGGNRIKMTEYGLADRLVELNTKLIQISKEAVGGQALVAADITMTGAQLEPLGDLSFETLIDVYKEQIGIVVEAGADLIVIETMMSLQETRAAVIAAKEVCPEMPVMATLSFSEAGKTLYGADAAAAVVVLQELGVDAVGLNCSAGPDKMKDVFGKMQSVAKVPLIVKPNAGLPQIDSEGNTCYDMSATEFQRYMKEILAAGASLAGGCCGTDPTFIAALADAVEELQAEGVSLPATTAVTSEETLYLASERAVYPVPVGQTLVCGDGIDLADPDVLEEYQNDEYDTAIDAAYDLQDDEADVLLFQAVAEGVDEAEALCALLTEVTGVVPMPVVVAVSSMEVAEKVLRSYSGVLGVLPLFELGSQKERFVNTLKWYGAKMVTIDKQILCC